MKRSSSSASGTSSTYRAGVNDPDDRNRDAINSSFGIGSCPLDVRPLSHSGWIAFNLFSFFGGVFRNHGGARPPVRVEGGSRGCRQRDALSVAEDDPARMQ